MNLAVKADCSILFLLKLHLPFGNLCFYISVSFLWLKKVTLDILCQIGIFGCAVFSVLFSDSSISGDHHSLFHRVCRIFFTICICKSNLYIFGRWLTLLGNMPFHFGFYLCSLGKQE